MGHNYSTTITPDCEMGQHLKFEDRVSIKIYRQQSKTRVQFVIAIGCFPSTVMYELKRGTPERNGDRGRLPSYSPKRGRQIMKPTGRVAIVIQKPLTETHL